MPIEFRILKNDAKSRARIGIIKTPHGKIHTPAFINVATQAAIKALEIKELKNLGAEAVLCNTYHLMLRPGADIIKKSGGLHRFMNWDGPIITDSGGFQVFSLGFGIEKGLKKISSSCSNVTSNARGTKGLVKIDDKGVTFRSHIDGSLHRLTPKISIEIQQKLGADIIFAFDECPPPFASHKYSEEAMERTHKWAKECLRVHKNSQQALFGIVQGGEYKDLRKKSAKFIGSLPFDGFGVGGSFGKEGSKKPLAKTLEWIIPELPENKPRHFLGIGGIEDIFVSIRCGVDMFDCVSPTRLARQGMLYLRPESGGNARNKFRFHILNSKFKKDFNPIDKNCNCEVCKNFSRAYLHHLFKANEILAYILATKHNIYFIQNLFKEIRKAISKDSFSRLENKWLR